jgi:hypothetical protein
VAILGRLIEDAQALGYRRIHLDTGRFMMKRSRCTAGLASFPAALRKGGSLRAFQQCTKRRSS